MVAPEFMCQHPRWNLHSKVQPCSVYMSFHKVMAVTTYIVVSGEADPIVDISKQRLKVAFAYPKPAQDIQCEPTDPFLFHSIIAQESFVQSKSIVASVRYRLCDQLHVVDDEKNAKEGTTELALNRDALRGITKNLHKISQDADVLVSSTEMGTMVIERMATAHRYLEATSDSPLQQSSRQVRDMMVHLTHSLEARKWWVLNYKSRKDTAMNLASHPRSPCTVKSRLTAYRSST